VLVLAPRWIDGDWVVIVRDVSCCDMCWVAISIDERMIEHMFPPLIRLVLAVAGG
jgi:hypothetical protein